MATVWQNAFCPLFPATVILCDKVLAAHQRVDEFTETKPESAEGWWHVVADGSAIIGVISKEMLYDASRHGTTRATLAEIARRDYATATENTSLYSVLTRLCCQAAPVALVLRDKDAATTESLRSIVTKEQIVDSMTGAIELCSLWSD